MHVCKWRYAKREASRASVLKYALIYVILIEFTEQIWRGDANAALEGTGSRDKSQR